MTRSAWRPFVLYGLCVTLFCVYIVKSYEDVKTWPITEGTIITAVTEADPRGALRGDQLPERLTVLYRYEVNGKSYEGDRLSYLPDADAESGHWVERYPVGGEVDVYYNPAKPQEAFLNPLDKQDTVWIYFILFLHAALVVVGSACMGWRVIRKRS